MVENGGRAGAEAVVDAVASAGPEAAFRYLHSERANKSAALNAALAGVSDDTLCVFFDDDVLVEPGTLAAYAEAGADVQGEAFLGGSALIEYEEAPPDWIRQFLPLSARGLDVSTDFPGWFLGFNWAAFAGDVRAVGGFDPEVGPGSATGARGQETDMQNRLKASGLVPIPVPEAVVTHYVPKSRSSPDWVVQRAGQLGASAGRKIALGQRRSTMRRELTRAVRSALLLPLAALMGHELRVVAYRRDVARAAGLVRGYWGARRPASGVSTEAPRSTPQLVDR